MKEQFRFQSDLFPCNIKEGLETTRSKFGNDILKVDSLRFSDKTHGSRGVTIEKNSAEIKWANAVFYDEKSKIVLEYDYNTLNVAYHHDQEEEKTLPYKAVITISESGGQNYCDSHNIGRFLFYYDKEGKLTVIKNSVGFKLDVPVVSFKKFGEFWKIIRFENDSEPVFAIASAYQQEKEYSIETNIVGQISENCDIEIDEVITRFEPDNNKFRIIQKNTTNSSQKIIEVSNNINIQDWKNLIGGDNWQQLLKQYPIKALLLN